MLRSRLVVIGAGRYDDFTSPLFSAGRPCLDHVFLLRTVSVLTAHVTRARHPRLAATLSCHAPLATSHHGSRTAHTLATTLLRRVQPLLPEGGCPKDTGLTARSLSRGR